MRSAEAERRFNAAAQSAFEWEAHSAALTSHFEGVLAERALEIKTLNEEGEILKALNGSSSNQSSARDKPENGDPNAVAVATAVAALPADMAVVAADRKRIIGIAKTWMAACDKSWEHLELRRFFDALQMNYKFEVTKRVYKQKCKEYLIQERVRLHSEAHHNISSDPTEEGSINAVLSTSRSDADGEPCCKTCGRPLNGALVATTPAISALSSASGDTSGRGPNPVVTIADLDMMSDTIKSWGELRLRNKKFEYGDNSSYLLLVSVDAILG
jgi:hypothetical protein